jgi:hypothetical protein
MQLSLPLLACIMLLFKTISGMNWVFWKGKGLKEPNKVQVNKRTWSSPRFHLADFGGDSSDDEAFSKLHKEDGRPVRYAQEDIGEAL